MTTMTFINAFRSPQSITAVIVCLVVT